jgi:hypothetical protein
LQFLFLDHPVAAKALYRLLPPACHFLLHRFISYCCNKNRL